VAGCVAGALKVSAPRMHRSAFSFLNFQRVGNRVVRIRDFVHADGPIPATSHRNPLRVRSEWATVAPTATGSSGYAGPRR
jgi:hypothetical protein